MHHSRLCAVLIDCRTSDVDEAARFWGRALGRPMDLEHPGSRGNYRMLETPQDEPIVQIQRVEHDVEVNPTFVLHALGGDAGAHWSTLLCRTGTTSRFPEKRQPLGLGIDPLPFSGGNARPPGDG